LLDCILYNLPVFFVKCLCWCGKSVRLVVFRGVSFLPISACIGVKNLDMDQCSCSSF
jgi:hypothetical protein